MSIELQSINKRFGSTQALQDINLQFAKNKIYGLLGNNGAGKTTLLNIITNRLYATSASRHYECEAKITTRLKSREFSRKQQITP